MHEVHEEFLFFFGSTAELDLVYTILVIQSKIPYLIALHILSFLISLDFTPYWSYRILQSVQVLIIVTHLSLNQKRWKMAEGSNFQEYDVEKRIQIQS